MELKPGYKQTESGVIPADWKFEPLGKHASFRTGPFGSALHKSDYISDGVPVVNPMHIIDGRIVPTADMTITENAARSLAEFRLSEAEIVIGRRGEMGRCAVVQPHQSGWLCGTGSMIVRPTEFDPHFLQRVLSSEAVISAIVNSSVGTTMVNLNQGSLSNLKVQYPPLPEQSAIATVLGDVDALLAAQDSLIEKKRSIKQGAMQELLTGKRRLPGYGGDWAVIRLGDVAHVKTGPFGSSLHERDYVSDGTPIITVEHLGERGVEHLNLPMVSGADRTRLCAYSLEVGDVVFSRVGSVDRNALIRESEAGWLFSGRLLRVRPNRTFAHPMFLSYQFHSEQFKSTVRNVAVGQTMASLNTKILNDLIVHLPCIEEQTAIAHVLGDMDSDIAMLEAKRENIALLKQGMGQELLTGRIRLL